MAYSNPECFLDLTPPITHMAILGLTACILCGSAVGLKEYINWKLILSILYEAYSVTDSDKCWYRGCALS